MAHIRQSRPDSGLGVQVKFLTTFKLKMFELFPPRSTAVLKPRFLSRVGRGGERGGFGADPQGPALVQTCYKSNCKPGVAVQTWYNLKTLSYKPSCKEVIFYLQVGLGSEDDVVVNTEDSGLMPKAQPWSKLATSRIVNLGSRYKLVQT